MIVAYAIISILVVSFVLILLIFHNSVYDLEEDNSWSEDDIP